jgi:hypothetical protein
LYEESSDSEAEQSANPGENQMDSMDSDDDELEASNLIAGELDEEEEEDLEDALLED